MTIALVVMLLMDLNIVDFPTGASEFGVAVFPELLKQGDLTV